ncbi:hypothetical protein LTR17_026898 [Elasticomyces elasticus]|nr:hypothetical protein LTR17_026898 [Elasticomyces elasticus]
MDQIPRSNDAYNNLFADNQQYHAYDNQFLNGTDSNFQDASWSLNASNTLPPIPVSNSHLNNVNRSLSHSPAPFGQNAFNGYPAQQSFQPYQQQAQYDPAIFNSGYNHQQPQSLGTIAPQALQQTRSPAPTGNPYAGLNYGSNNIGQQRNGSLGTSTNVNQHALIAAIPKGVDNGYMSVIDFDQLVRATNSERMGNFISVGRDAQEWPVNRTTTVPVYVPRKSKNELRRFVGNDRSLLEKIGKKSLKKELKKERRPMGIPVIPIGGFKVAKPLGQTDEKIKYEGDTSSSEESDDDDSSYTSEEEDEESPLPAKRPESLKGGVEYDAVKALWRPKRKYLSSDELRTSITDFWEVVKVIRDRWKIDAAAVVEAEEKNRKGELPLLKSRVKDQRDMIEVAFKAALKHGHREIVQLLGSNHTLVYVCYQFLLDRHKEEEYNGPLARVTLELMTLFTTLSNAILEKTHLDKVLQRYVKKGDAKTQYFAKRIVSNAAAAVDTVKDVTAQGNKLAAPAKAGNATSLPAKRPDPEPVAGIKRPASNSGEGGVVKKPATMAARANGVAAAAKPTGVVKRPATGTTAAKAALPTATITKTKQVSSKPSSFFSSLQSATKKPGTSIKAGTPAQASGSKPAERKTAPTAAAPARSTFSFAETMANLYKPKDDVPAATKQEKQLPPETAEARAKRLRKEERRKLHVSFKIGEELEQIRYFTHDPEEEIGHDDSQMRDVSDVGGEGRMLKLHADQMEVDEDDGDDVPEQKLIEFKQPRPIDFSVIEDDERNRNYVQCGGKLKPESAERAVREQYEADTLIVFYTDEKDIPANPREPGNPYTGEPISSVVQFGAPEEKFEIRAKQKKAMRPQPHNAPQQRPFDMSSLGPFVGQHAPAPQGLDIQKLLASLNPSFQQQPLQAPPMMGFPGAAQGPPPSFNSFQPPQQHNQQLDLSAILAAIQPGAPQMGVFGAPPMMGYQPPMQQAPMAGHTGGYKTEVCKYWQKGKCTKGDSCTYLHESTT